MAKTKRKQLAALAAIKFDLPVRESEPTNDYQNEQTPSFNGHKSTEYSPEPEVRQQRVIIWIPSTEPRPQAQASGNKTLRSTMNITSGRKRKRSNDKGKEKASVDADEGRVYQNYAKVSCLSICCALLLHFASGDLDCCSVFSLLDCFLMLVLTV